MRYAPKSPTRLNQRLTFPAIAPVKPCQLKVSLTVDGGASRAVLVLKRT